MDWFRVEVGFHGDDKVLALREEIGNHEADAFVSRIYAHCYLQEKDRFPKDVAPAVLERAAEWRGKTGKLVRALMKIGFVERDGADLVVHGVKDRLEKALKLRQQNADRQQRARDKRDGVTRDGRRDDGVSHVPTDGRNGRTDGEDL